MRRFLVAALALSLTVAGWQAQASAEPPGPATPGGVDAGWTVEQGRLTWRSDKRIPMGDAAVEFWSGDKLLGRPRPAPDGKTFTLDDATSLGDLTVRAGGKRIDRLSPGKSRKIGQEGKAATGALPPNAVDPGKKGPYRTTSGEYNLDPVKLPDFPEKVEMRAVVVAPVSAPGKRPLALFLHGRHAVCYHGADEDVPQEWPCPAGTEPIPSYRGYLQAQQLLASQGYLTVSISANGINGQDWAADDGGAQARSSLVRLHLARWAEWASNPASPTPAVVRSARPDLSKVFLMGHSRGGEGVSRAAMDTLTPPPAAQDGYHGPVRWTIRGLLLIGPTIFGHDPVPDVPSATILPGCDGDVYDLQGQMFVDATRGVSRGKALHSALYVVGANHNFFNTEWTPGQAAAPSSDDFTPGDEPDPVCSPGAPTRLTATQQQNAGATYIAAAARLFAGGDDRVRPLLDGSGRGAPSAYPARVLSAALGANRTALLAPGPSVRVSAGARICEQVTDVAARSCLNPDDFNAWLVHFTTFGPVIPEPGRYAAALSWTSPGRPISLSPARPVSLRGSRELALRVIVPPSSAGTRFTVSVTGEDGKRHDLGDARLDGLPAAGLNSAYWGQEVRVSLRGFAGRIAALQITPRSANGKAWLLDAWGWNPGTPDPREASLPRIDIGEIQAPEGDAGSRTYQVPVKITGRGGGVVRLFLVDGTSYAVRTWLATVRPGARSIPVPVEVKGDTLFGEGEASYLYAKTVSGFVIGDYSGGIQVVDDDPRPAVTWSPTTVRVAEGGALTWPFTLSAPTETPYYVAGVPVAPTAGAELSSTDVDPDWFTWYSFEDPEPSRPLSSTGVVPWASVEPGRTTGELSIPTITDTLTEPDESVVLHTDDVSGAAVLTGVVTAG
ncbi:hypothetical protein ACQP2F_21270 [Actinoplanes sp. CA-030573]|uniref:hypothetical protein n=1 Tax=Actinoplanes sp. CA-030573 TaxID=3239898 RepID=UPI003D8E51E5